MTHDESRYLFKNGHTYVKINDPKAARERRERAGYMRGYTDGEKFAILKPPSSIDTPLPTIDNSKLPKSIDFTSYVNGFRKAYFNKL
jgi:hypothetical protein